MKLITSLNEFLQEPYLRTHEYGVPTVYLRCTYGVFMVYLTPCLFRLTRYVQLKIRISVYASIPITTSIISTDIKPI